MLLHAEHRLRKQKTAHVSFFILFLASAVLSGLGAIIAWRGVSADDIVVRARVGDEVVSGPTTVVTAEDDDDDEDDDSDDNDAESAVAAAPVVSIEPADEAVTYRQISDAGRTRSVPVFTAAKPSFQGTTTIHNALITFEVRFQGFTLRSSTRPAATDTWYWQTPEAFPNGRYVIRVTARDPELPSLQTSAELEFIVEARDSAVPIAPPEGEGDFEVFVTIPPAFETLAGGDTFVADITLVDNAGTSGVSREVRLEYAFQNRAGETVFTENEQLMVTERLQFLKSFYLRSGMTEGEYFFVVKVPSEGYLAAASAELTVRPARAVSIHPAGKIDYNTAFAVLAGMFALATLLSYLEYTRFIATTRFLRELTERDLINS